MSLMISSVFIIVLIQPSVAGILQESSGFSARREAFVLVDPFVQFNNRPRFGDRDLNVDGCILAPAWVEDFRAALPDGLCELSQ